MLDYFSASQILPRTSDNGEKRKKEETYHHNKHRYGQEQLIEQVMKHKKFPSFFLMNLVSK